MNKATVFIGMTLLSLCLSSCKANSNETSLKLTISTDGGTIKFVRGSRLLDIVKMVFWEQDSGQLVWAIARIGDSVNELGFGDLPKPNRTELGYIDPGGQQFFPKGKARPDPLLLGKKYYVYVETVVDFPALGQGMSSEMFEVLGSNGQFIIKRIHESQVDIPNCVNKLWGSSE